MSRSPAAWLVVAVALLAWAVPTAQAAPSKTAFALSGTSLLTFDPATPGVTTSAPITGVNASETLVGIDVRPQNGYLYGFGVNATANTGTLYVINRKTGVTGAVGTVGSVAFTTTGGTAIDIPDPAVVGYGFDVNPSADRMRVTAGSLNFRVNPNTGAGVDNDANSGNGVNPDGAISGGTTVIDATAYTNNKPNNGGITSLYGLDASSDSLFISTNPNGGSMSGVAALTVSGSPLNFTAVSGFDIDPAVNAPASNAAVTSGVGYATLNVGGTTGLYTINLVTGQATYVGNVGNGSSAVQGLALQRSFDDGGQPAVALAADGATLVRFASTTPSTTTTQALGAPAAGETLVAVALRPQTGQYYAFGANDGANTATLYLLDPQTGTITAVGAPGVMNFVDGSGNPVDFPSGAAGWGMDFNPTVDRVRVTTTTGLNFRVNPNTGAPVDGNLNGATVPGVNPDAFINGAGVTGVAATSYTNAFTQSLTGGTTTQYTLDPVGNALFVQNPPNAGTQTAGVPVKVGGATLDFDTVAGFDIAGDVNVDPFFGAGSGEGLAALRVGGTTSLYRLDLPTGAATSLGTVGAGATALRSLAVGDVQRPAPAASRAPGALAFGSREITSDVGDVKTTTVTNTTSTPVTIVSVSLTGDSSFTVSGGTCVAGLTLQKNQTCEAGVSFKPTTTGAKSGTLTIDTNAPDLTAAVTGTGTRTLLTTDLAELAFGSRDTKAAPTILGAKLTNAGTEAVTLAALGLSGTNATDFAALTGAAGDCAAGTVLTAGQTCTARVQFVPGAVGPRAATLNITSNAAAVPVTLSGTGTTVVLAPGNNLPVSPVVPAPTVKRVGKAKVNGSRLLTGLQLTCPTGRTSPCTASLKVTRTVKGKARKLGSATVTVKVGTSVALTVKPSKANLKLLKTARKLKLKLTVAPGGGATKSFTTTLKKGRA